MFSNDTQCLGCHLVAQTPRLPCQRCGPGNNRNKLTCTDAGATGTPESASTTRNCLATAVHLQQSLFEVNFTAGIFVGGQQQRVALARALAAQPKLLLLDEPFSALDENLREDMRNLVLQLLREFQMTVILVTHDREEALSMSDRIALMFGGKLIQTGTPKEVYTQPASRLAADYFGNCVYIYGKVENGIFCAPGMHCNADVADGSYVIMLRPDALDTENAGDYMLAVEAISFRGSDTQVTFRSEDGTLWKKAYSKPVAWQTGETIYADLQCTNPVLFPL